MTEFAFALDLARRAGGVLCHHFQQEHTVHQKSSVIDLVTEADLASETLIVEAIRHTYPQHTILSEEGLGDLRQFASHCQHLWLVDPLDGTINYAHGVPFWAVSLAYAYEGQVVLGVIYDPLRDEMFWAENGKGAWLNGKRVHVSHVTALHEAIVATGFPYQRASLSSNNSLQLNAVMPRVQGIRRAGAAVLDLAYLAAGRYDAYWELHLQPWDWAAGWLLVKEAGGKVTDIQGAKWSLGKAAMLASNGRLHDELLERLSNASTGSHE